MREILFRGKTAFGAWVHGDLIHRKVWKSKFEVIRIDDNGFDNYTEYEVATETIGQYTGLTDKNGKKIFEGDVVKAVIVRDLCGGTENREETGIIGYDKIGMIGLITEYDGTIPVWSDFFQELTLSGCIDDFWFEVIGNIHDNPDLLDEK